jgi:NADPH:quinone reductase-like Zn-dependent oxidoreductase
MRALVITEHGSPDVMRIQERPDPQPGPGEVRVRVHAAGINFADLMARTGLYPDGPKPPCVVGYEIAGDVESVGPGVEGFEPGQRVMGGTRFGGYAELVAAPAAALLPLPEGWSYEEGAALPVVYSTAYAALVRYGSLHAGERVLIHAAAGGVGIAATQIAKLVGAEIYGTASASKHEAIRGFGVDHPIDYRSQDFAKEVRRISGDKRALDLVLDGIGGNTMRKGFGLLRAGGRLVGIGISAAQAGERRKIPTTLRTFALTPPLHPLALMSSSRSFIGINMLRLWDEQGSLDEFIQPLLEWVEQGAIRPVVSEAFPLEQGPDAHRYLHERRNVGKVVLTL